MRFNHRSVTHWLAVALIAVVALFTFTHAWGQSSNAAAVSEDAPGLGGIDAAGGTPR